jgi:hypothetical protein
VIPETNALPSEYRTKSLNDLIKKFQKDNNDQQFYLNEELEKEATRMINNYKSGS